MIKTHKTKPMSTCSIQKNCMTVKPVIMADSIYSMLQCMLITKREVQGPQLIYSEI